MIDKVVRSGRFRSRVDFPQTYNLQIERISKFKENMDVDDGEDVDRFKVLVRDLESKIKPFILPHEIKELKNKHFQKSIIYHKGELTKHNKRIRGMSSYHDTDELFDVINVKLDIINILARLVGLIIKETESTEIIAGGI